MTDGADAAGGLIAIALTCVLVIVVIGVHLAITYWIYSDARKRGNPNAAIWALLNFLSDPLGLVLYLLIGRNQTPSPGGPPPAAPPPETTTRL